MMRMNFKKFSCILRIGGALVVMGALLVINGCGGGGSSSTTPPVLTASTQVTASQAKVDPAGTVTTTDIVTARTAGGSFALEILPDTTITGKDANGNTVAFTTLPVINVSTPTSGMSGMPAPKPGTIVISVAGVCDISFGGFSHVTFSRPVIISIPVTDPSKLTNRIAYTNNSDGLGWIPLGPATINAAQTIGTVQVTSLSGKAIDVAVGSASSGGTPIN